MEDAIGLGGGAVGWGCLGQRASSIPSAMTVRSKRPAHLVDVEELPKPHLVFHDSIAGA